MPLTDRELDAAIAEKVMGWKRGVEATDRGEYLVWKLPNGATVPVGDSWPQHYSTDRNAAALVLKRIAELGLAEKLVNTLSPILPPTKSYSMQAWTHMAATPRHLMEAALVAMENGAAIPRAAATPADQSR